MRILIVDDEPRYAAVLKRLLVQGGDEVETAHSLASAAAALAFAPALVVTDLRLGDGTGIELLGEIKRRAPQIAVVLMTAFAEVSTARQALTCGALDYLVKPFDNSELVALVERVRQQVDPPSAAAIPGLIGTSPALLAAVERLRRFAASSSTVLITGESGTGKEASAQAIHRLSPRAHGPWVELNCGGLPAGTLDSELFGHERGSFTGAEQQRLGRLEQASGGTLFLDEIGEMPLEMQPKLLRFLQARRFHRLGGREPVSVDVRVVAATNRDLAQEVAAGRFRGDLFHRLAVATIALPPLRERLDDLPQLAAHLLARHGNFTLTPKVQAQLAAHSWPGNVRELGNVLERAALLTDGSEITAIELSVSAPSAVKRAALELDGNERQLICEALLKAGGNKSRAAELLGITRRRLYSRMEILNLQ